MRQGQVMLEMSDDGMGLADAVAVSGRGANLLGGTLQVVRNAGHGTRLVLCLPSLGS